MRRESTMRCYRSFSEVNQRSPSFNFRIIVRIIYAIIFIEIGINIFLIIRSGNSKCRSLFAIIRIDSITTLYCIL